MRVNRFVIVMLAVLLMLVLTTASAMAVAANNIDEIRNALKNDSGNIEITLAADSLNVDGNSIQIRAEQTVTINLNGHSIGVLNNNDGELFEIASGGSLTIIGSGNIGPVAAGTSGSDDGKDDRILFKVAAGGALILNGGTYSGNQKSVVESAGSVTISGTASISNNQVPNSPIVCTGGTLTMNGGSITGNTANYGGGIRLQQNTTMTMTGGTIRNNIGSVRGGGVYLDNGSTVTISGDAKIEGNRGYYGGAIFAYGGSTVHVNGGYISNNSAVASVNEDVNGRDRYYYGGGGGIYVDQSSMEMTDGTISSNCATVSGGGILLMNATLKMTGGVITENHAVEREGGGIAVKNNSTAVLSGGAITKNTTGYELDGRHHDDYGHWGGGGIFVLEGAKLYLPNNTLIIGNRAGGYGGGVAGCSTGQVYLYEKTAIYGNRADGENLSTFEGSTKPYDHLWTENNEVFLKDKNYQDYFSAFNSVVSTKMYNEKSANWAGSVDGVRIDSPQDDVITATYLMGLTANPTNPPASGYNLLIEGNESYTHGGGILCNGHLYAGTPRAGGTIEVSKPVQVNMTKKFEGSALAEGQFTFRIEDSDGNVVAEGKNNQGDDEANIFFGQPIAFNSANCPNSSQTLTYYLYEVLPDENPSGIAYDESVYELTFHVVKGNEKVWLDNPMPDNPDNKIEVNKEIYKVDDCTVKKIKDSNGEDISFTGETSFVFEDQNAESHPGVLTINASFDNKATGGEITVKVAGVKTWKDDNNRDGVRPEMITVNLLADGIKKDTQVVTAGTGWAYQFVRLPKFDGEKEIVYTVTEEPVNCYTTQVDGYNIINTQIINPALPETGDDNQPALYLLTLSTALVLLLGMEKRKTRSWKAR